MNSLIGIVDTQDEVYITDRDNKTGISVDGVTLAPTWDIDRAGSKGRVTVTAEGGVLEAGMWLSTYRTITPERGSIIRYPRGHWHLFRPGKTYDGGYAMDTGAVSQMQTATGSDIVDDIAGVVLTEPFYTPVGGNVMQDVHILIKMASAGIITPIPIVNPSFETVPLWTGWTTGFGGGAAGFFSSAPGSGSIINADARRAFGITMETRPVGAFGYAEQLVDIPPGISKIMMTGLFVRYSGYYDGQMLIEFRDESNSVIGTAVTLTSKRENNTAWYREALFADLPEGTARVRIRVSAHVNNALAAWARPMWDDIRLYGVTHDPIPDDRIQMPVVDVRASTRIQTSSGKNVLYDAINADRLGAMGYFALSADFSGILGSTAMRTLENAIAKYTFGPGDIALIGNVEIPETTDRPFNHWHARKEDFQDATLSISADSHNNNANDPFSVIQSGQINSAPEIVVQDAVDQAALQAVADRARDSYVLSETVRFATMPLADLTVYDVVAIDDPDMPDVNGKWALNSIDASGDYLVITATRAVSREI